MLRCLQQTPKIDTETSNLVFILSSLCLLEWGSKKRDIGVKKRAGVNKFKCIFLIKKKTTTTVANKDYWSLKGVMLHYWDCYWHSLPIFFFMLLLLRLLLGWYPVASHPIILFWIFPLGIKHSRMYKRTLLQAFYSGTWYNTDPRDWRNMFAIMTFCSIEVLFHVSYYFWGKDNQGLCYISKFHCTELMTIWLSP